LVHSRHPQIVLTDLIMPYMSGMEVLERIMEFDPTTEVILASIESGRAGALCVLTQKPKSRDRPAAGCGHADTPRRSGQHKRLATPEAVRGA